MEQNGRLLHTPIQSVDFTLKSHFGPVGTSGDPIDAPTGPGMLPGPSLASGDARESTPGAQLDYFAVFQSNLSARRANPFLATNCAQYCTILPKAWISVQNHTLEPWGHQGPPRPSHRPRNVARATPGLWGRARVDAGPHSLLFFSLISWCGKAKSKT